jgi:nitrous oxide reductase accessory protein NosL
MIIKPENPEETEIVYVCDSCGGMSSFSDYRWPGHKHWADLNYTLCNDCLRGMSE